MLILNIIKKKYAQSVVVLGGSTLLRACLTLLIAKILIPSELGSYSWSISLFGILNIIANFGCEQFLIQKIPKNLNNKSSENDRIVNYIQYQINKISFAILFITVSILIYLFVFVERGDKYSTAIIFAAALPFAAHTLIKSTVIRVRGYTTESQIIDSIIQPILLLILIWLIYGIIKPNKEILDNDQIIAFAFLTSWITTHFITKHKYSKITGVPIKVGINKEQKKEWQKIGIIITLGTLGWTILGRSDILILGFIIKPEELAAYFIFIRLAEMATLFAPIPYYIWGAKISELHYKKDYNLIQNLITKSTMICASTSIVISLLIYLFSDQIVSIINPIYIKNIELLYIALIIFILKGATGILNPLLYILGEQNYLMKIQWILGIIFTLTIIWAAENHGVTGAMISFGLIQVIFLIFLLVRIKSKYNLVLIKLRSHETTKIN